MSEVLGNLRRRRLLTLVLADGLCWALGFVIFGFSRYLLAGAEVEETLSSAPWTALMAFALVATIGHVALASVFKLQHGRHPVASVEDTLGLLAVGSAVGLLLTIANLVLGRPVPGTVPLVATALSLLAMVLVRAVYRTIAEAGFRRAHPDGRPEDQQRVIVLGAGDAGRQLITSMLRDASGRYLPVALLDDDVTLRHRRIRGVPVVGGREQLAIAADQFDANTLVIAIPSAKSDLVRELSKPALDARARRQGAPQHRGPAEPGPGAGV